MHVRIDGQGIQLAIPPLGHGGEGNVYQIIGRQRDLAKIYHSHALPGAAKWRKLKVMTGGAYLVQAVSTRLAWPKQIVCDQSGQSIGIVIPYIPAGIELSILDTPISRNKAGCHCSFRDLINMAVQAAECLAALHRLDVVMGDVNFRNFIADATLQVNVIDLDSAQITYRGETFACDVGMGEFQAPETLINPDQPYTRATDVFGLGVVIFRLFFQGCPPYAGGLPDTGNLFDDQSERVKNDIWLFGNHGYRVILPSGVAAVPKSMLTPEVWNLFNRTFSRNTKSRPTATEYSKTLSNFSASLKTCTRNPRHHHLVGLDCPWCAAKRLGHDFFPKIVDSSWQTRERFKEFIKQYNTDRRAWCTDLYPVPNQASSKDLGTIMRERRKFYGQH